MGIASLAMEEFVEVICSRLIYLRHLKMYAGGKVNGVFTHHDAEELEILSSFFLGDDGCVRYNEAFELASWQSIMDAQLVALQRVRILTKD